MESSGLVVGQRVRVAPAAPDGLARRALVLTFEGTDLVELEYEQPSGEEEVVPLSRCSALLPFEEVGFQGLDAEALKSNGNALFKLRDASGAIECYVAGMRCLQTAPCVGARVLVKATGNNQNSVLRSALVLSMDLDGTLDICYEPDLPQGNGLSRGGAVPQRLQALLQQAEAIDSSSSHGGASGASSKKDGNNCEEAGASATAGSSWWPSTVFGPRNTNPVDAQSVSSDDQSDEEEENGVARERVVLAVHGTQPSLQCALLLNSAKCSLLSNDWAVAHARALRAERIAANDAKEPSKTLQLRRTALIVAARASLGMQRFSRATTYAGHLLAAPVPAEGTTSAAKEIRTLLRDIQRRAAEVKRSNKALAKSLSTWVATAMAESGLDEQWATLELT